MANFFPIVLKPGGRKAEIRPPDQIDPSVLPPGSGGDPVAVKVDTPDDLPDPLDPNAVYHVGNPKSIVQVIDGETCYSRLANTSTAGIITGQNSSVLADENGVVIWRF